ncbi:GTP-binding protein [Pisolithus tinctorius]|nr:GTP-binding protein [Pisolithus tinctorius]
MDPEKAKKYLENIEKFRILVIGRNAGKMTILQRVCNSVDEPDVFDGDGNKIDNVVVQGTLGCGYHKIKDELVFKSNPGFVFHDSPGFKAGSAEQFEEMKRFVMGHAVARTLKKCIHAIWYCIPMTDYHRTVTAAEQKFFNECDTGHVPVVVLLTRADALNFAAFEELLDEELEVEEAEERVTERESLLLEKWQTHIKQMLDKCKFPPKMYLPLTKMYNESADCTTLIQCTASALNEEGLQRLLLSTQQSSIGLCIEYAVNWVVGE